MPDGWTASRLPCRDHAFDVHACPASACRRGARRRPPTLTQAVCVGGVVTAPTVEPSQEPAGVGVPWWRRSLVGVLWLGGCRGDGDGDPRDGFRAWEGRDRRVFRGRRVDDVFFDGSVEGHVGGVACDDADAGGFRRRFRRCARSGGLTAPSLTFTPTTDGIAYSVEPDGVDPPFVQGQDGDVDGDVGRWWCRVGVGHVGGAVGGRVNPTRRWRLRPWTLPSRASCQSVVAGGAAGGGRRRRVRRGW